MSDAFDGGAAAPAEVTGAPLTEDVASAPTALGSQVLDQPAEVPKPEPAKKPPTLDEAIAKAEATVKERAEAKAAKEAKTTDAKPEKIETPKAEAKEEPIRGEGGKFASAKPVEAQPEQPQTPEGRALRDPPARFDDAAKADWEKAPESVKGAIQRTIREMEQGHQKYRGDAEAYEPLKTFAERAKMGGTDLPSALSKYVGMEDALRQNPIAGLNQVLQNLDLRTSDGRSLTLRDVAAHIMGQTPDQQQTQSEATIMELRRELAAVKEQIGGVTQTFRQQQENATVSQIEAFAAQPEHSRFDELAEDITFFLTSGRTTDLAEAYELAERLNPAPATASNREPLIPANTQPQAQTLAQARPLNPAGQKSISGAPSTATGSPPRKKGPLPSLDESLDRAFARR